MPPLLTARRDFAPMAADGQAAFLSECAGFGDFYTAEGGLLQPQA